MITLVTAILLTAATAIAPGSVRKESESYLVERGLLTSSAADEIRARVHPVETHATDGRHGWLVLGDALEPLGIRSGDVVITINGKVPDSGGEVVDRARRAERIVIELERRRQPLKLTYSVKKLPPLPAGAEPPASPPAPAVTDAVLDAGIRKITDDEYEVLRSLLEPAMAEGMRSSGVRVVPEMEAGAVRGFRLFGIRPGSLLARVGVMNGDVVLRINGRDMTSPDAALACYTSLRSTPELLVELKHAGAPRRIKIRLK